MANAIATLPQLLGIMLGYVLGPVFIRGTEESTSTNGQFAQLAFATVAIVLVADFFAVWYLWLSNWKGVPEIIQCPTATSREIVELIGNRKRNTMTAIREYLVSLYNAYTDCRGYGMLTLLAGSGNGLGVIIITATSQILCTYGYDKAVNPV